MSHAIPQALLQDFAQKTQLHFNALPFLFVCAVRPICRYKRTPCHVKKSPTLRQKETHIMPKRALPFVCVCAPFQCPSVSVCVHHRPYLSTQKTTVSCPKDPHVMFTRAPCHVQKSHVSCQKEPHIMSKRALPFGCVCAIGSICRHKRTPYHVQKSHTLFSKEPYIMSKRALPRVCVCAIGPTYHVNMSERALYKFAESQLRINFLPFLCVCAIGSVCRDR